MKKILAILMLNALLLTACNAAINVGQTDPTGQNGTEAMEAITATAVDNAYVKQDGVEVIYFAGG